MVFSNRFYGHVFISFKDMDEETRWIYRHIKRRECSHFIPKPSPVPEDE